MKFLFINKPLQIEPLGLMYISSAIKQFSHETKLALTTDNLEKKVEEFKPDFIGYSIMTGDQKLYDDINKRLKDRFSFFSIAGGPHPTFFPESLKDSSFDAFCLGEGERAIQQFIETPSSLRTSNFWFKKEGRVFKNPVQHLSYSLDNVSFPDRKLLSGIPEVRDGPISHFIASRGCPFKCSYCFNESFRRLYHGKGNRTRFRSPENLVAEIKQTISSSPAKFVYFQDDTFTLSRHWLSDFAELYSREVKLPFHCHVRANTIDEEKIEYLKKAGCYSVHVAAETADDYLRNEILKRDMSKEEIFSAAELLRSSGIKFMLQNIIGLPEGSLEKDLETLEMNIKCQPDYSWVSIFQPYPGTALGEFCKEKGYYKDDFSDLGDSFFDSSKLSFNEKYKNQLANLQKLFAVAVEHPDLYNSGLLKELIELPYEATKEPFTKFYRNFRKKGDRKLYGFDL